MIYSRLCVWRTSFQVRRSLHSFNLSFLHHVREDITRAVPPSTLHCLECNRTFSISRPHATAPNVSNAERLARSRPRLMRELEAERKKDNLSPKWDLIFTSKESNLKLTLAHWACIVCGCALPVLLFTNWWDLEHEEDILIASVNVSRRTEYSMFILLNAFILTIVFKNVRCVPKRIYFDDKTGNYLAVCRSWFPWSTVHKQFKAEDIRKLPFRIMAPQFKIWKDTEYFVLNRRLAFPHMSFRNGQDRYWMLRFVET